MSYPWYGTPRARTISPERIERAAREQGLEPAVLRAVWEVEASGGCYRADGSLQRRFEPHKFPRALWSEICFAPRPDEPLWRASLRLSSDAMLQRAYSLDPRAALMATSWGAFQIMGMNYAEAGFSTVFEMVARMAEDPDAHLDAFLTFCHWRRLLSALRDRDWLTFAVTYNGPANARVYADKLAAAYEKYSRITPPAQPAQPVPAPVPAPRSLWQVLLDALRAAVRHLRGQRA